MSWTWPGVITAAFLILSCWNGYRRGFVREVVSAFFILLSLVVVWAINPYVNKFIRENTPVYETIYRSCEELVEDQAGKLQGVDAQGQDTFLENLLLPGLLVKGLKQNNTAEVYQYLAVHSFAEYVAGYLSAAAVNGITFLLSFVLASLLIRMVTYALNIFSRLPVLNGINRVTGALVGLVKGVLFVWIAFLAITIFCSMEAGRNLLAMIREDRFLNLLYESDVFVRIFMSIFYGSA